MCNCLLGNSRSSIQLIVIYGMFVALFYICFQDVKMLSRKRRMPIDDYLDNLTIASEQFKKREQFYESIRCFYRRKWSCPFRAPSANGQEIDLFVLYEAVCSFGGWQKVTALDRWNEVLLKLGIDSNIQMAEHAIHFIYMRFLSKFEQSESGNDGPDDLHEQDMLAGRMNRFKSLNTPTACSDPPFSVQKSAISTTPSVPEFHKLVFALLSGLPNEVSFGLNVLTILSHPGPFMLNFSQCPHLINVLVALCGICIDIEDPSSLSHLYDWWRQSTEFDYAQFWANACLEEKDLWTTIYNPEGLRPNEKHSFVRELMEDDLLNVQKPINWRIYNIMAVFHNLSFEECNAAPLAQNRPLIRLLLCVCNCRWQNLRKIALETLSNISKSINLLTLVDVFCDSAPSSNLFLRTFKKGLHSADKFMVLRSMEIIAGLCRTHENESLICDFFEESCVLERIFTLLALKDILLHMVALDAVLQITNLGRSMCEMVARLETNETRAIEVLVGLLTTDAASFGNIGLAGIKVVELHGEHSVQPYIAPSKKNLAPLRMQPYVPPQTNNGSSTACNINHGMANNVLPPPVQPVLNPDAYARVRSSEQQHEQVTANNTTAPAKQSTKSPNAADRVKSPLRSEAVVTTMSSPTNNGDTVYLQPPSVDGGGDEYFMCEWLMQCMDEEEEEWPIEPCARFFPSASQMLFHIYDEHLLPLVQQHKADPFAMREDDGEKHEVNGEQHAQDSDSPLIRCRWPQCDNTLRSLWSITTHLQDIHCTDHNLERAMHQRLEMGFHEYVAQLRLQFERTREQAPPPAAYSQFAAIEAIRRHAYAHVKREITDDSEGPITRSIRLTSALILRNICRSSVTGRMKLRKYEGFISWMSLSRMESSRTLAQCLAEIVRHTNGEQEQRRQLQDFGCSNPKQTNALEDSEDTEDTTNV